MSETNGTITARKLAGILGIPTITVYKAVHDKRGIPKAALKQYGQKGYLLSISELIEAEPEFQKWITGSIDIDDLIEPKFLSRKLESMSENNIIKKIKEGVYPGIKKPFFPTKWYIDKKELINRFPDFKEILG